MNKLDSLEELFGTAYREMGIRAEIHNEEENRKLKETIDNIKRDIKAELRRYRFSARIEGQIDSKLDELNLLMSKMNNGKVSRLVQESINDLKREEKKFQEENGPENDEKENVKESFLKVQNGADERRKRNKEQKDYMYIQKCTQDTFQDIRKNIFSYIETSGMIDILGKGEIDNIGMMIVDSYKKNTVRMKNIHDQSIDNITQTIEREVETLYDNVQSITKEKSDNRHPELGSKAAKETKGLAHNPWAVENYGMTHEQFNTKAANEALKSSESNKQEKQSLPSDVLR